jgi:hypothetical protein
MNRRGFLAHIAALAPVVAIAPELAEALAPKRRIFLPPAGGWPKVITFPYPPENRGRIVSGGTPPYTILGGHDVVIISDCSGVAQPPVLLKSQEDINAFFGSEESAARAAEYFRSES